MARSGHFRAVIVKYEMCSGEVCSQVSPAEKDKIALRLLRAAAKIRHPGYHAVVELADEVRGHSAGSRCSN